MPGSFPSDDGHRSQAVAWATDAGDAATEVADLVTAVARRLRRHSRAALEPLGVTWAQVRALRAVAADGPLRMSDLADRLQVVRRSATSVVDELVEKGLVARSDDPDDRRAVVVDLTPAGRRLLARLDRVRADAAQDLLADLPAEEVEALAALLRHLLPER